MKKAIAAIEQAGDGRYSVYVSDDSDELPYGLLGTGDTKEAAIADFRDGYQDMRESFQKDGEPFEETLFSFRDDCVPDVAPSVAFATTPYSLAALR
jgi:hypothetical protein